MTELKLLDANFKLIKPLTDYSSLLWENNFFSLGKATLVCNQMIEGMVYLYNTHNKETAVLTSIEIADDTKHTYYFYLLKHLLFDSVIPYTEVFYNKTGREIAEALVAKYAQHGIVVDVTKGRTAEPYRTKQITGDNLLTATDELLELDGLGSEVYYEYETGKLGYRILEPLDSTVDKPTLSFNRGTVITSKVSGTVDPPKNYAYVAGEVLEGQPRTAVVVDLRASADEIRREIYVDARDLQSSYTSGSETVTIPDAEYKQMLVERGLEELKASEQTLTATLDSSVPFVLGEKRLFQTNYMLLEQQITSIITGYENGGIKQTARFGTKRR